MSSEPLASPLCSQLQTLLRMLAELSAALLADPLEAGTVQPQISQLQNQFQSILTATAADAAPSVKRLRPYQTEAHRRLRLLGIEAMRLRTARQPATLERQRSQLQTHLTELQKFAQAMADQVCP